MKRAIITGIKTKYKTTDELLGAIATLRSRGSLIQVFNPDTILNKNHLLFALAHARSSFARNLRSAQMRIFAKQKLRKKNIAKKIETELLLRAAGTHKINNAIELVGVKNPKQVILLAHGKAQTKQILKKLRATRADSLLKQTTKKTKSVLRAFAIDTKLLKSYSAEDLLLEKLASLDVFV